MSVTAGLKSSSMLCTSCGRGRGRTTRYCKTSKVGFTLITTRSTRSTTAESAIRLPDRISYLLHRSGPRFCSKQALPKSAENSPRSEEHTSELQSRGHLVCRLLLDKKK